MTLAVVTLAILSINPSRSPKNIQKLFFPANVFLCYSIQGALGAECNMAHIYLSREKCALLQFTLYNQEGDENCYWDEEILVCSIFRNKTKQNFDGRNEDRNKDVWKTINHLSTEAKHVLHNTVM